VKPKRLFFLLIFAFLLAGSAQAQTQATHPPTEKTDAKVNKRGSKRDRHRKAKWISMRKRKLQRKERVKKSQRLNIEVNY
jgi:hypothetical protein